METGIIRFYDREKTICDVVRFRNSLGIDIPMKPCGRLLPGIEQANAHALEVGHVPGNERQTMRQGTGRDQ